MSKKEQILIIEAGKTDKAYWFDLFRFRELLFFLAWRDILVRYKQTFFGVAWAVLKPLITMIVFVAVFGYIAKLPSNGVPYPILVFAALLPWQFFSSAFAEAAASIVTQGNIISKIYFPRMLIPISAIIVALVDFLISFILLCILMVIFGFVPSWQIIFLPLFILLAFMTTIGASLLVAALNVKYRDFRYIIPFIVQFGLYISPVGFSSSVVPEQFRILYSLNPMVGVIDGFRWAILGGDNVLHLSSILVSTTVAIGLMWVGIWYFRRTERAFADQI